MKVVFSVLALSLASVVAATDYHHPPPPPPPSYVTEYVPGKPVYHATTVYYTSTSTSLCPITTTVYEGGKTITKTYLSTSTIYTKVPTVIYETVKLPDKTTEVVQGVTVTSTSLCPVTETKTIGGAVVTLTHTSTSTYVTVLSKTDYETKTLAPQTTNVVQGVTVTSTSLCPVTETKTIGGTVVTLTHTSTSTYVTVLSKTDYETKTLAPQTTNVVTYDYSTSTSYCPVTVVQTVSGKPVTVVHTSTSLIVEKVEKTIVKTHVVQTTEYLTSYVHQTIKTVETEYTTVEAGHTITLATTLKNTVMVTDEYIITKTLEPPTTKATVYQPITLETSIPVTHVVTLPSEVTITFPGTTAYAPVEVPTTLTTVPTLTITSITPQNTTSAPLQISDNAAPTNKPIALAMAGGMALLAAFA